MNNHIVLAQELENRKLQQRNKQLLNELHETIIQNYRLSNRLESYERKSNIGKKVFSIVMYLNSMIREYPHCRIECIKWELFAITVCDGKTAEEIEKKQDEKNNFNFILARPDWFITVK